MNYNEKSAQIEMTEVDYYTSGIEALEKEDITKAKEQFKLNLTLYPNHSDTLLQLFMIEVVFGKIEDAVSYFEKLYRSVDIKDRTNYNHLLYLLSYITELPDDLKEIAVGFNFSNLVHPLYYNKSYIYIKNAFDKNFIYATEALNKAIRDRETTLEEKTLMALLTKANEIKAKRDVCTKLLINKKDFTSLRQEFSNRRKNYAFGKLEIYTFRLVLALEEIGLNGVIPKIQKKDYKGIFDAIDARDYKAALILSKSNCAIRRDNNLIITLLLNSICEELDMLSKKDEPIKDETNQTEDSISPADRLYAHGRLLSKEKEFDKAYDAFRDCLKLEPTHYGANFELFALYLIRRKYNSAFNHFRAMYKSADEQMIKECNFYLYLMKYFAELPDDLKSIAKGLDKADCSIVYDPEEMTGIILHRVQTLVLNYIFLPGFKVLNDLHKDQWNLKMKIVYSLMSAAENKRVETQSLFMNFIEKKDFNGMLVFLTSIKNYRNLSSEEEAMCIILSDMDSIIEKGIIPTVNKKTGIYGTLLAIENHDYKLAKALNQKYLYTSKRDDKVLATLLDEIVSLIEETEKRQEEADLFPKLGEKHAEEAQTLVGTLDEILSLLRENNSDLAYSSLHKYLEKFQKLEYEEMLKGIIQLSILGEDSSFYDFTQIAIEVIKEKPHINIEKYIEDYRVAMHEGNVEYADVCLQIVIDANILSEVDIERLITQNTIKENDKVLEGLDAYYNVEGIQALVFAIEAGMKMSDAFKSLNATVEQKCIVLLMFAKEQYTQGNYKLGDKYLKVVERSEKTDLVKTLFNYVKTEKKRFQFRAEKEQDPHIIMFLPNKKQN